MFFPRKGYYVAKTSTTVFSPKQMEVLNDTSTRRQVFDIVTETNDDLSIMEVHQILDALVQVCSDK